MLNSQVTKFLDKKPIDDKMTCTTKEEPILLVMQFKIMKPSI